MTAQSATQLDPVPFRPLRSVAFARDLAPGSTLAERVRPLFPTLQRQVHGRPLIYLDTAATSLKPHSVIDAEARFYRDHNANVHRGVHTLAEEATAAYEETRLRVAHWLGVFDPAGVVFTRNATAALNLIARGFEHRLQPGDEVLLTEMEHHANLVPWIMLARRCGVRLRHIPITDDGQLDLAALPALLGPRTRLVALTHVSNVLGTINPVAEVAAAAHAVGALVVVDAAQSVGRLQLDLDRLGADLLVWSAHKCYGPLGVGVLVGRHAALAQLEPVEGGGDMIREVTLDAATWADIPYRFEAGTPNVAGVVALQPAIDLLEAIGASALRDHDRSLGAQAWEALGSLGGLELYGPADPERRTGLICFNDPRVHPHDLAAVLDQHGIAVRAGHHCAQPLHRRLGVAATVRASFGVYTTGDEIRALVDGIRQARRFFA